MGGRDFFKKGFLHLRKKPPKLDPFSPPNSLLPLFAMQESESENKLDGETASDSESKSEFGGSAPVPTSDDTPEVLNRALSNLSSR